jgi:hypothetical protein
MKKFKREESKKEREKGKKKEKKEKEKHCRTVPRALFLTCPETIISNMI